MQRGRGQQHRRACLGRDFRQRQHAEVTRHLGEHGLQRRRASACRPAEFLGARPGHPQQRHLGGCAAPGRGDQRQRGNGQPAHRVLTLALLLRGRLSGGTGFAVCPPGREQLVLQAEHLGVLARVGVVVAEQVQDAVRAQQLKLGLHVMAGPGGLPRGDLRAQHHVTQQAGQRARLGAPVGPRSGLVRRPQLVHRERENVGRPRPRPASARAVRSWPARRRAGRESSTSGCTRMPSSTWRAIAASPASSTRGSGLVGDLDAHAARHRARLPGRRSRPAASRCASAVPCRASYFA